MAQYLVWVDRPFMDTPAGERLKTSYPTNWRISDQLYIVTSNHPNETGKDVSERIFPRTPEGNADLIHAVFLISSWWGWADRGMWEWLQKNKGPTLG